MGGKKVGNEASLKGQSKVIDQKEFEKEMEKEFERGRDLQFGKPKHAGLGAS